MMNLKVENVKTVEKIELSNENLKETREKELDQAAYKLSDELWLIKDKIEKSCLLLKDITDDYFRKFNRDETEDHLGIIWEFPRNATYADIIDDYIFEVREIIGKLEERGIKVSREKHERGLRNEG